MKKILKAITVILLLLIVAFFALKKADIPLQDLKTKYCNSESKFIQIDSMNVHYRIEGDGKPIVLIHGTGACLQSWDEWTDTLKKYYKVVRLDMPGFGLTGPRGDKDYSIKRYVSFLDEFLKAKGIDSFALAGNSLGGEIAWNYAAAFPGKVTHLILVDPGGFYLDKNEHPFSVFALAKHKWFAEIVGKLDTRILVKRTLNDVFYDDSKITPEKIDMYHDMSLRAGNRQAFTDRVQLIGKEKLADVSTIKSKTLLMWGKEDQLINISLAEHFKSIPGVENLIYEKVGHSPQEEIPQRSVQDAMNFIH
ncbi:MAG: alpha/beta hydrolase [Bacteroidota bacterium]|nr:alpha/beta hydrolase [Bacteroidota bacterium]